MAVESNHRPGELLLERYRVDRVLGRGGFGTTYAATDEHSNRSVALKALDLSRVSDWKSVELFEREARTLEQLEHPQIPRYFDFVPVRDRESGYLIQALAPGRSLEELLEEQGGVSDDEIVLIAERALEVLVYLSSRNPPVVHRDIKPGNLIFDGDELYVVDFGAVAEVARHTISGGSTVAGTFGYMAPEQLHGEATPVSDLYGLGMTLVHLASGVHPTALERNGLKAKFRDRVDLPPRILDLIDRMVEPEPARRFSSPGHALEFLRKPMPEQQTSGELVTRDADSALVRTEFPRELRRPGIVEDLVENHMPQDLLPGGQVLGPTEVRAGARAPLDKGLLAASLVFAALIFGFTFSMTSSVAIRSGLVVVTFLIALILGTGRGSENDRRYRLLKEHGVVKRGRIRSAHQTEGGRTEVRYAFTTESDALTGHVSFGRRSSLQAGAPVLVAYVPGEPTINALVAVPTPETFDRLLEGRDEE